jgi:hypothetical protein
MFLSCLAACGLLCGAVRVSLAEGGPFVQAMSADAFVDSIGTNAALRYVETPYVKNWAIGGENDIGRLLIESGIRHIRSGVKRGDKEQIGPRYAQLFHQAGIRTTMILNERQNGLAQPEIAKELIDFYASAVFEVDGRRVAFRACLDGIEGPNEYDISNPLGGPRRTEKWTRQLVEFMQWVHGYVKEKPGLVDVPIMAPSMAGSSLIEKLGGVADWIDVGNAHPYPSGQALYDNTHLARALAASGNAWPGRPLWVTETGYHTATSWTGGNRPVSERAQRKYDSRLLAYYFKRGVPRTYFYEFSDSRVNPAKDRREAHFGMVRIADTTQPDGAFSLQPKPTYYAIRNLIGILGEAVWSRDALVWKKPNSTPGGLCYAVTGNTARIEDLLLQKHDGRFYLLLWNEASVYDHQQERDLENPPVPIKLVFARRVRNLGLYRPGAGTEEGKPDEGLRRLELEADGLVIDVDVPDELIILEFRVGQGQSAETRTILADGDTYVRHSPRERNTVFGSADSLLVREGAGNDDYCAYVQFDLSALEERPVEAALLEMSRNEGSAPVRLFTIDNKDFEEESMTGRNAPEMAGRLSRRELPPEASAPLVADVTGQVNRALQFGHKSLTFGLRGTTTRMLRFHSRESESEDGPRLQVILRPESRRPIVVKEPAQPAT